MSLFLQSIHNEKMCKTQIPPLFLQGHSDYSMQQNIKINMNSSERVKVNTHQSEKSLQFLNCLWFLLFWLSLKACETDRIFHGHLFFTQMGHISTS